MSVGGAKRFDDASRFTLAAGRAMEREGRRRFAQYGLTLSDVAPLVLLAQTGPMTPTAILERELLLTSAPVVSHSINRLVEAGFVRRQNHSADGRSVLLEITDAGLAVERDLVREIEELQSEFFSPLTQTEAAQFSEYLRRCLAELD